MEYSWKFFQTASAGQLYFCTLVFILLLFVINVLLEYSKELIKHFSKKSLQENEFSIIFASEKERDHVYSLIEKDKQETENLEKQAKDFGLK